jgi:hypothetical protein
LLVAFLTVCGSRACCVVWGVPRRGRFARRTFFFKVSSALASLVRSDRTDPIGLSRETEYSGETMPSAFSTRAMQVCMPDAPLRCPRAHLSLPPAPVVCDVWILCLLAPRSSAPPSRAPQVLVARHPHMSFSRASDITAHRRPSAGPPGPRPGSPQSVCRHQDLSIARARPLPTRWPMASSHRGRASAAAPLVSETFCDMG